MWLLAWGSAGCDGPPPSPPADAAGPGELALVDQAGRTVELPGPARRVISLVPSATQTLLALGAADRLVGRTDYDPQPELAHLPSVGGGIEPSVETLVSLTPDLVIRFAGEQDTATPERLDRLGIEHLAVRPDRIADALEAVELVGRAVGAGEEAERLVARLQDELDEVRRSAAGAEPVRAAYVLGGTPPWVSGPGTYIHELIALAGGVNVFADLDRLYAPVSPETFVERPIDVILVGRGVPFDAGLAPSARVAEVGDAVEIPGPRVAEAARAVARALRPGGP